MTKDGDDDGTIVFPGKNKGKPFLKVVRDEPKIIDYQSMLVKYYRNIVKDVLGIMANDPVSGKYCFTFEFDMSHPDVVAPMQVLKEYPRLITIVLNHQYDNLVVSDDVFDVTVYFNSKPVDLTIPYASLTMFRDDYADFSIGFGEMTTFDEDDKEVVEDIDEINDEFTTDNIVSFDEFRNKD